MLTVISVELTYTHTVHDHGNECLHARSLDQPEVLQDHDQLCQEVGTRGPGEASLQKGRVGSWQPEEIHLWTLCPSLCCIKSKVHIGNRHNNAVKIGGEIRVIE